MANEEYRKVYNKTVQDVQTLNNNISTIASELQYAVRYNNDGNYERCHNAFKACLHIAFSVNTILARVLKSLSQLAWLSFRRWHDEGDSNEE